jgi:type I restriction enzyme M protein
MANPPFAGDIKETRILAKYDLARSVSFDKIAKVDPNDPHIVDSRQPRPQLPEALHASHEVIYQMADGTYRKVKVKHQTTWAATSCSSSATCSFLKPGGRMAVVFRRAASTMRRTRPARIHRRALPHPGRGGFARQRLQASHRHQDQRAVRAEVERRPRRRPAVSEEGGLPDFLRDDARAFQGQLRRQNLPPGCRRHQPLLDEHGHLIVKHDLFNHDGETEDGIAEAFIRVCQERGLSFFR